MNPIVAYFTILYGLMAGMGYCAYTAKRIQGEVAKRIFSIEIFAIITLLFASVYLLSQNITVCYIARAGFYILGDLLVLSLLHYAEVYTGLVREKKWQTTLLHACCTLDGLFMILNIRTHHIFKLSPVDSFGLLTFYRIENKTHYINLHFAFFYSVMALSMLLVFIKMTRVPRFYRKKYGMILAAFLFSAVCNFICWPLNLTVDLSLLVYCIMGTSICYFSLVFLPNGLVEKTMAAVIQELNSGIIFYDISGNCIYINELAKEVFEAEGTEAASVRDLYERASERLEESKEEFIDWDEKKERSGEEYMYRIRYQSFVDEDNKSLGSYVTVLDRTEEVRNFEKEHIRASRDPLTGIYNREYFFRKVKKMLEDDCDHEYYMVCSDIRDFKLINDLFGIEMGNEVLLKVADVLKNVKLEYSVYGRLQGDKFAILMREEYFSEEKLVKDISSIRDVFKGTDFHLHTHVGVYKINDRNESPSIMCDRASLAIDTLRGDYSRIVAYYDDSLMKKTMEDKRLVSEYEKAIENEEFCFYIQPQCDRKEHVSGGEALVRWLHPELGFMPPGRFIEVYEKTGLIYKLDAYIWEQVVKKLKQWKEEGKEDYYISVNISPIDFYYADIYKTITSLVEKYEISPKNLKLEITETAIMSEVHKNLKILHRLKEYGFTIEIDDFGSGYSSLNTLKDIPADVLKLDMGFINETENVERSRAILESVVKLAHQIGMTVICEGVEQLEQIISLKEIGCEMFQGYYYAKPMPVKDFEETYMK